MKRAKPYPHPVPSASRLETDTGTVGDPRGDDLVYGHPRESQLSFPRKKPKSLTISIAYRITTLLSFLVGRRSVLEMQLFLAWLLRRLAHEMSVRLYGEEFLSATVGVTQSLMRQWIPTGGRVLDLGCGAGRASRWAAPYAAEVIGVDFNPDNIRAAEAATDLPNVRYVVADINQSLESLLEGRFVDVALLLHVLEHIDDVHPLLVALGGVARRLIVEVPDFDSDGLNSVRMKLGLPFYTDADHVREYTLEILREQLANAGWSIVHSERVRGVIVAICERA